MQLLDARKIRFIICALVCAAFLTTPSFVRAQQPAATGATITGTVLELRAALPVPGAAIALVQGDHTVAHATSDPSGAFTFSNVAPGIYNLQVSAAGYQTARSDDIVVGGAPVQVSVTISRLQAANISSEKTIAHVTTRASGLQTTTAVQTQIDPKLMQNVGQLRAAEGLAELPGVNLVGQDSAVGDDISVDIRGLKPSETQVLLDGHPIGPIGVYPSRIGGGNGGFDYQVAPLFALQNTLVTYGSGATGLYGVDAVGGAVDFQTIQASQRPEGLLKMAYGDMGTQIADAQATGTLGKLSYAFVHGIENTLGNFPGAIIPQTGIRGNDFTSATLSGVTYYVSGNYNIANDLAKVQYAFSPATNLSFTAYAANSLDDKTGEGDNDFVTYDYSLYQAQHNTNCTTGAGSPGLSVSTDAGTQCYTPQQYAANASGPAGGGPGAYQHLGNQDYHARMTTTEGRNLVVLDSYLDNYTQYRERPESFVNGPLSILDVDYRSMGTLLSDDISLSKNDVGFGLFSMRQYTNGDNISGTAVLGHAPIFDRLNSFFVREVYQPSQPLSFFLNAWMKSSNVGGNSFDPRLSILFRPTRSDMLRLTGGKSSADPAPLALQLTGVGGIGAGNCKIFSVGEAQSPNEQPERAADLEFSYGHRFNANASVQGVLYDTNETNTIFQADVPASNFQDILNAAGSTYLPSIFAHIQSICPNFSPPSAPPTISNLVVVTNVNLAKQRARGIELSGNVRFHRMSLQAYYDVQSSAIFDAPVFLQQSNPTLINGSQLVGIPLQKYGATLDWTLTDRTEYYMDYTHFAGNNPLNRGPFGIANAALTQTVTSNGLAATLGVTNLFNEASDIYGRIGLGVFIPENSYGTDTSGLQQGTEQFGLAPRAFLFTLSQKV